MADLRIEPCRSECDWGPCGRQLEGEELFACASCGSEWVPSQPWTPVNADGALPDEVRAARRRASG